MRFSGNSRDFATETQRKKQRHLCVSVSLWQEFVHKIENYFTGDTKEPKLRRQYLEKPDTLVLNTQEQIPFQAGDSMNDDLYEEIHQDAPLAAKAINRILDVVDVEKAVHFCFGNYGGQTIQQGSWNTLIEFLNSLHVNHLVLEIAHRPESDLDALTEIDSQIQLGIGVVDIKVNHIETPDEIARRIEKAEKKVGSGRIRYVHPDCGFWMLKRSIADRKIEGLVKGRDLFLDI